MGGAGADEITIGNGTNLVFGDGGFFDWVIGDPSPDNLDLAQSTSTGIGGNDLITVGDGNNLIVGGAGTDTISGGTGFNVILGDSGRITAAAVDAHRFGGLPITLGRVETIDDAIGAADSIQTGSGSDVVLGGAGADGITTGDGTNLVFGDNGRIDWSSDGAFIADAFSTSTTIGGDDTIQTGAGNNLIVGGFGMDSISSGAGFNVIVGDNGEVDSQGNNDLPFGGLALTLGKVFTTDDPTGARDTITTGSGSDVVLGGAGGDAITLGSGTNLVFGDNGEIDWAPQPHMDEIALARSTSTGIGGDDTILTGDGNNLIVGGFGTDTISGGTGFNVIVGDSGQITAAAVDAHRFGGLPITLGRVETIDDATGATDSIVTGDGSNVILGGAGADGITTGDGTNLVFGDNGRIDWSSDGAFIADAFSTSTTIGGDDTIQTGAGNNLIVGGFGMDSISSGAGFNVIVGDNGEVDSQGNNDLPFGGLALTLGRVFTTDDPTGARDTITTGSGSDVVLGGAGGDAITLGSGTNLVFGDNGEIDWAPQPHMDEIALARSTSTGIGGDDTILTGDGNNLIVGGFGTDTISGGSTSNVILGDNGVITGAPGEGSRFGQLPITLGRVETLDNGIGSRDVITTNGANDLVMGGAGDDQITIGTGTNLVFGDGGFFDWLVGDPAGAPNTDNLDLAQSVSDPADGNDTIQVGPGNNLIVGGGGSDAITVTAGAGFNVIVGDSGRITRAASDTNRFGGLPITLGRVETIDDSIGATDTIATSDGSNVILGGAGADQITTGDGTNLVFGDNGFIDWAADGDPTNIDTAASTSPAVGGADTITLGNGNNLVIGGAYGDTISGGSGFNVILGDSGEIDSAGPNSSPFGGLPITLGVIQTTAPTVGGADTITTGSGSDVVLGGPGSDTIVTGDGTNIVLADDGEIDWALDGNPADIDRILSTNSTDGGNDTINVGSGSVIAIGGYGSDTITGGTDSNVIIGDNGEIDAAAADSPRFGSLPITLGVVKTTYPGDGSDDTITTGSVSDVVLGGPGADTITTGGGTNVVLGDDGQIDWALDGNPADIDRIFSTDPLDGGNDRITIGVGNAIVIGGAGSDTIVAGSGDDIVVGDNGEIDAAVNDAARFGSLPLSVGSVYSTSPTIGGDDKITGGNGRGIYIGGIGNDTISAGDGGDLVIGDNGLVLFNGAAPAYDGNDFTLDLAQTTDPAVGGGNDTITTGAGDDVIVGGQGADTINAGNGSNTVLGDDGVVTYFAGELDPRPEHRERRRRTGARRQRLDRHRLRQRRRRRRLRRRLDRRGRRLEPRASATARSSTSRRARASCSPRPPSARRRATATRSRPDPGTT